jgi:hypothetical protein
LNQTNRYFFYGSPANYALVGLEDRRIWLVSNNLKLLQFIAQAFDSKITLVIFDLTTFKNYTLNLVDNTVCFNWQVPINILADVRILDTRYIDTSSTIYTGKNLHLINNTTHDLLLPVERCYELQQQLMCIHEILKDVDLDNTLITSNIKEIVSVNLELIEIESELYNLANKIILESSIDALYILTALGRLYK